MAELTTPPLPSPEIFRFKDSILEQWHQLPLDHQATLTLVLLKYLVEGESGSWILSAIEMLWKEHSSLYSKVLPVTAITHADLKQTDLTEDEIARLTENDLRRITHDVAEHYANDVFWEEVEFLARLTLAEKGSTTPKE